jgi:hypothetical protein
VSFVKQGIYEMKIANLIYTALLPAIILAGCDNQPYNINPEPDIYSIPLNLSSPINDVFTVSESDFMKRYSYTSDEDQVITLRISVLEGPTGGTNSAIDTELTLDKDREIDIDNVLPRDTSWKDIDLKTGETIDLDLSAFGTFRSDYYEFEVEIMPGTKGGLLQDAETYEPNDTKNTSSSPELNNVYNSELLTGHTDQCDVYRYDLARGVDYTLTTTALFGNGSSTTGGIKFSLIDNANTPVIPMYDLSQSLGQNTVFNPTQSEPHFLQLCSPSGTVFQNNFFEYEFAIWEPRESWADPFSGISYEPNDSAALAYEVDINEHISSELLIGPEDYIDAYRVTLWPTNTYELTVTPTEGPTRSNLSRLKIKVTDLTGEHLLLPEKSLNVGVTESFILEPSTWMDGIIHIYYSPTTGHERDYHAYELKVRVI